MKDIYVRGLGWVPFLPREKYDPAVYTVICFFEYQGEVYLLIRYGAADMGFYYYTREEDND